MAIKIDLGAENTAMLAEMSQQMQDGLKMELIDGFATQMPSGTTLLWSAPASIEFTMSVSDTGFYSALPARTKTISQTIRKDGRVQLTCTCGAVPFPHRYGSVEGCE